MTRTIAGACHQSSRDSFVRDGAGDHREQTHVDLCDQTVARADDVEHGKQLAVAVLAAAAHTCE